MRIDREVNIVTAIRRHCHWTALIFAMARGGRESICILRIDYSHYPEIATSR